MVCSICGQSGHNRRSCPQRGSTDPGNPLQRTTVRHPISQWAGLSLMPPPVNTVSSSTVNSVSNARTNMTASRSLRARKRWKKTIKNIINLKKFVKSSTLLFYNEEDLKYCYYSWLKIRDIKGHLTGNNITNHWKYQVYNMSASIIGGMIDISDIRNYLVLTKNACVMYHLSVNDARENSDKNRKINLINLKDQNYLVYWVVGNLMLDDIDNRENNINYMGMLSKKNNFKLKTTNGHRFYLVSHRLDLEPPYHPQTDKQFFIEPYLQINIHDDTKDEIYIDDGEKLSELNRWKFNALKLDYLIKELIKLGAKNNDVLDSVLDLHQDIKLDNVGEWYKDIAGVPSTFTNIT